MMFDRLPPRVRGRGTARRGARRQRLVLEQLEPRVVLASVVSVGDTTYNLAAGAAGYVVTRSGDLSLTVGVGYTVTAGTAVSGTNYSSTASTGVVRFGAGATSARIPLSILPNNFAETSREFTVELTGVVDLIGAPATFADSRVVPTGNSPTSVTTADVNGDGKLDMIVSNTESNSVSVRINLTPSGSGTPFFSI